MNENEGRKKKREEKVGKDLRMGYEKMKIRLVTYSHQQAPRESNSSLPRSF